MNTNSYTWVSNTGQTQTVPTTTNPEVLL